MVQFEYTLSQGRKLLGFPKNRCRTSVCKKPQETVAMNCMQEAGSVNFNLSI